MRIFQSTSMALALLSSLAFTATKEFTAIADVSFRNSLAEGETDDVLQEADSDLIGIANYT